VHVDQHGGTASLGFTDQLIKIRTRIDRKNRPEDKAVRVNVSSGLRAKEISHIRGSMVTDAQDTATDTIHLFNGASKGKRGVVRFRVLLNIAGLKLAYEEEIGYPTSDTVLDLLTHP
jgi:hypothetical protein